MGSICKRKIKESLNDENYEDNCRKIEELLVKLNSFNRNSQTGIWPETKEYKIAQLNNEICSNFTMVYDLTTPLIMKHNYIYTAKEYFAAKKILRFLKNKNTILRV